MAKRRLIGYAIMATYAAVVLIGARAIGVGQPLAYVLLAVGAVPLSLLLIVYTLDEWALFARSQPRQGKSRLPIPLRLMRALALRVDERRRRQRV